MAGYIRQSVADIINGAEITAPPLNAEFNQLVAAFNASSGHSHTGATGEAPKINLTTSVSGVLPAANGGTGGANKMDATSAPVSANDNTQGYAPGSFWENTTDGRVYICVGNATGAAVWRELVTIFTNNKIEPVSHNAIDLGTPSVRFQDLFLSGGISAAGNVSVGGTLNITALSTLDSLTVTNSSTMNNITTSGNVIVGGTLTPSQIDVNAGTIDGAVIGGSSPQAITGTLITANTNFAGALTGNVTGNLTGNTAGTHTGAVIGDVTGNVTTASGTSSFNNLTVNGTLNMNAGTSATIENLSAPSNDNDAARKADVDAVNAAKLNLSGGTMSGDIAMGNNKVTGLGTPTSSTDATTKEYVDNEDDLKLNLSGGTMSGDIAMGSSKITGSGDPTSAQDVATKVYTDTQRDTRVAKTGDTMSGALAMGNNKITGLATPTASTDAVTKGYVDQEVTDLVGSAPGVLNTLNELAAALGDDANFSTTITNSVAGKLPKSGGTMTGAIAMGSNKVTGVGTPTANADATNKSYVDTVDATKLNKSGDNMSGDLVMGSNAVTSTANPSTNDELSRKGYVDAQDATKLNLSGGTISGTITMGANKVTSTATPITDDTLTRKGYVDTQDALKLPKAGGTMSGAIAMGANKITSLGNPTAGQDASTKSYTDTQRDTRLPLVGGTMTGGINMGANKVTATYTPSANADLTNKTYVDGILGSATVAATSASNAATSETNAATSAAASSSSATAAATAKTNAETAEANAETAEANALASQNTAATQATNAANSAAAASTSATTSGNFASSANTHSTSASTQANIATTKASQASASATASANSATASASSATDAQTARTGAEAALDQFDDIYLGAKSSNPTVDNDGNAIAQGALYFNTTDDVMKVYEGSSWVAAFASLSGSLLATNNLSDLQSATGARNNLGLGTAATTAATAYATAAQGTKADAALPKAGGAVTGAITTNSTFDGRNVSVDGTKLDTIETSATADQTASEIRSLVESASNSNVFTDADHTKLNNIETSATADQTASEIRALVESASDSNVFTNADHTKLNAIEAGATADQTKSDIEGLYINVPANQLTGTIHPYRLDEATTQAESDDSTKIATTAYVTDKIQTLIGGAPSTLNDLNELAAAINDDANYNTTLTTSLATKLPKSGGTMTGDVLYNDSIKAKFGNGSDLQIFHNGSNSYVTDAGQGKLILSTNGTAVDVYDNANGHTMAQFINNGAVSLSYQGSTKIATNATGINVTGNVALSGTVDGRNLATDGTKLDTIATSANNYSHPTGAGYKHIPTGGSSNQILTYLSSGTAQWSNAPSTSDATKLPLAGGTLTGDVSSNSDFLTSGNIGIGTADGSTNGLHIKSFGSDVFMIENPSSLSGSALRIINSQSKNYIQTGTSTGSSHAPLLITSMNGGTEYAKFENGATTITGNLAVTGTVDGRDVATDGNKLDTIATSANNYTDANARTATKVSFPDDWSTALGMNAIINPTGSNQQLTAFGRNTLQSNSTGTSNTGFGVSALLHNQTGSKNTAMGVAALTGNSSTSWNNSTAFGYSAGNDNRGSQNLYLGYNSGQFISTGSNNTIVGSYDGNQNSLDLRASSNNIVLSDGAGNVPFRIDSSSNIHVTGNIDGRHLSADGTKLDNIESNATNTADPAITTNGSTPSLASGISATEVRSLIGAGTSSTDTNTTYTASSGLSLSGTVFSHADTSSQASVNGSGRTYIQDITLDNFGHVTAIATATESVTDTTYSIQDGELSQNNFTDNDHSKLNGITVGADVTPSWVPGSDPNYLGAVIPDNTIVRIGTSTSDHMKLWYTGTKSIIIDNGSVEGEMWTKHGFHFKSYAYGEPIIAEFNAGSDGVKLYHNASEKIRTDSNGVIITGNIQNASGNFAIDVSGELSLDADASGTIRLKDGGTEYGTIFKSGNHLKLYSAISDGDILLQGNDGGSTITALTLDMSDNGTAYFSNDIVTITGKVNGRDLTAEVTASTAPSGTSITLDVSAADTYSKSTTGNTTFAFSNPPSSGTVGTFSLILTSGGSHTISWPSTLRWAGGSAPAVPASGEKNIYTFMTVDGGSNYYGFLAGAAFA